MSATVTALPNLAVLRHQKGISLDQIVKSTKISVRYLEAIECREFSKLPGGVYNISYIRQYAKAIEISEQDLLECYLRSSAIS